MKSPHGVKRLLLTLQAKGITPDAHGLFVIPKATALTSLEVGMLEEVCEVGDYDWKKAEDVGD